MTIIVEHRSAPDPARHVKPTPRLTATLIPAVALCACASVTTLDGQRLAMTSPAFAAYVEAVFRRQNEVATDLAFELELAEWGSARYSELEAAELGLLEACAGLNELANQRREGRATRGPGAARRARGAAACEQAAIDAARALESDGDGS